jgi:DNA polymerase
MPADLTSVLSNEATPLVAHNAGFERLLLTGPAGARIGVPTNTIANLTRWDCTAARAAHVGLPRDLARACIGLNLPIRKDGAGHALMLRMCRPRSTDPLIWWEDDERMTRMEEYCRQDVEAEHMLDRKLPPLGEFERAVWEATERANDRGIRVDQLLLYRLDVLTDQAKKDVDERISKATHGAGPKVSNHAALTRWLISNGVDAEGVGRQAVEDLLENEDLDPSIRHVLQLRQDGGGSSSTKVVAIDQRLSDDGRIRGALTYGGATSTLRWSSHGAQLQNLPRANGQYNIPAILRDLNDHATLVELEDIHGAPLKVASQLLRPLFTANPSLQLVASDYSQIEARVLAWLAGQEDRLEVFRQYDAGVGPDLYRVTASRIYHTTPSEITKQQRQVGKTADLACGFQGGVRAFKAMVKTQRLKITAEEAEQVKQSWRAAHPYIVRFWRRSGRRGVLGDSVSR